MYGIRLGVWGEGWGFSDLEVFLLLNLGVRVVIGIGATWGCYEALGWWD